MPQEKYKNEDYGLLEYDIVLFGTTRHISEDTFTAVRTWDFKY
jgi:hypothetical protein